MPEHVAEAFLAELRFDPCCGAIAARSWRPDHRNEQPWIKEMFDCQQGGLRTANPTRHPSLANTNAEDETVN